MPRPRSDDAKSIAPSPPREGRMIRRRADALFRMHQLRIYRATDRLFAALLAFQWLAAIVVAVLVSPRAWAGVSSQIHPHILAALLLGGVVVALPITLALTRPGAASTRQSVAVGQSLMGALLIHLAGGRIEGHFHIFGSLALLAFYRDWRVLATASAVVAIDHFTRGYFWPYSVYGVLTTSNWRWVEHTGWVIFEDIFLMRSCVLSVREMREIADRRAQLEVTRRGIERTVRSRTAELITANAVLASEIVERARVEAALAESEARFRSLCNCSPVGIFTTDQDGQCTYVNPRARAIAGYTAEQSLGDGWKQFVHEDDLPRVVERWRSAWMEGRNFDENYRFRGPKNTTRWVHVRAAPLIDDHGHYVGHVGAMEDMTDRKATEDRLAHQATHDALTGLPNRAFFREGLELEFEAARARDGQFALLLIDLDRFKEINDTYGHDHGDAVLCEVNPRLREVLGHSDTLARLGGDEFAILLPEADESAAVNAAGRVLEALRRPIAFRHRELEIGASIGIALYPTHGADATDLLRHADVAMYAAKRDQGGCRVYSAELEAIDPGRLSLATELRHGIREGQLELFYQPKFDLRLRRPVGVEALVRWRHPRKGLLTPDRFIPLAEHTGLIRPLGLWVLESALKQSRLWRDAGLSLDIAVNLAPKNLRDPALLELIGEHLESHRSQPVRLTLEITEGTILDSPQETRDVLRQLSEAGVRVAIDDFGTGYSSLAYLRDLPVGEIKIDQSFVRGATLAEKDACIVRSVIDLGHNLGLTVVAEGVEDPATLGRLTEWGCDVAQGYHLARPMPAGCFERWISRAMRGFTPRLLCAASGDPQRRSRLKARTV